MLRPLILLHKYVVSINIKHPKNISCCLFDNSKLTIIQNQESSFQQATQINCMDDRRNDKLLAASKGQWMIDKTRIHVLAINV